MKLSKEYGFSLVELMIVMGLIGVAALGSARIMKNVAMTSKTSEIGMEVNAVMNSITQNLLSSDGCSNTLKGVGVIEDDLEIEDIKNRIDKVLFDKVRKYGNNRLKIDRMHIDQVEIKDPQPGVNKKYGEFRLQVRMEKIGKAFHGGKYVTKSVPLQAEFDLNNNLIKCYSATEDAVYTAKKDSCEDIGGTWVVAKETCELNDEIGTGIAASTERVDELLRDLMDSHLPQTYVAVAGDTMTGNLTINSNLSVNGNADTRNITNAQRTTSNEFCIGANCRTTFATQACPRGEIATGVNPDGTLNCRPIVCPAGTYFERIDSGTNNVICNALPSETCPLNQYVSRINANGSIVCSPLPPGLNQSCTGGRVVTGIQPNGTIVCSLNYTFSCPAGTIIQSRNSTGAVTCAPAGDIIGGVIDERIRVLATCTGGIWASGGTTICRARGTACPPGTAYMGWSATTARTCWGGSTTNCNSGKSCTTGSHSFSSKAREKCNPRKNIACGPATKTGADCWATITEVGCTMP